MALQLHLKPKTLTVSLPLRSLCPFFSSSSSSSSDGGTGDGDGDLPSSPPPPSFASFSDIREHLRSSLQAPPRRIPTDPPPPPPISKPSPSPSIEEIRKHLAVFCLKSSSVNPASLSTQNDAKSERLSMDSIHESLRQFIKSSHSDLPRGQNSGRFNMKALQESLSGGPAECGYETDPPLFGSEGGLPEPIFRKELREKQGYENVSRKTDFVKPYGYGELGEKLRKLRPDEAGKGKTGWFSLQELNERLVKLTELEDKETGMRTGFTFSDIRDSLAKQKEARVTKKALNPPITEFQNKELNERLVKLRELEDKETGMRTGFTVTFSDIRDSLAKLIMEARVTKKALNPPITEFQNKELNERLVKLRELEDKKTGMRTGVTFSEIRDCLAKKLKEARVTKKGLESGDD